MLGTIALDIDGTITAERHRLPRGVVAYLSQLAHMGWRFVFITGRTFSWGYSVLKELDFPYYLAVQNGAIILEMPSRTILCKQYLDKGVFEAMDEICRHEKTDYVLYGGVEYGDICYFRPEFFSKNMLTYVQQRTAAIKENWHPVSSYEDIDISEFPSIKCFGDQESALRISEKIQVLGLCAPPIRDPFDENYFVVQATHSKICKGQALQDLSRLFPEGLGKVVAAGDDLNDITMLAAADIKVVMATAPPEMLQLADIVAPPASEEGIIEGLRQALQK